MSLSSASRSLSNIFARFQGKLGRPLQSLEDVDQLKIVKQPVTAPLPAFISMKKSILISSQFYILNHEGVHLLTALEIDTKRQLQNFKYVVNVFSPDGKFLVAIVQRRRIPTKLHGKDSGDPTAYFKIDTLLPSKFVFWEKSTYAYRCQRFYEYDNMNPCAQCHVQWATGDLIGHIWKGYDHLVIVRANLSPVFGFFPTGEDRQESRVSTELMVTVYSDELAGRRPGQDGLVLSEIACGLQSHRLITRKLFQIPLAEMRTPFGKISCSNSDEILASDDEPAVLTAVDVYFPKDLAVQDKILILCAAFSEFCRGVQSPVVELSDDKDSNAEPNKWDFCFTITLVVCVCGFLLSCFVATVIIMATTTVL